VISLRASSFGSCIRAQAAGLRGMKPLPPPEKVQGWYDRGNEHETDCVAAMERDGWGFWSVLDRWVKQDGQYYVELDCGDVTVTGHLDGIAACDGYGNGAEHLVEIKAPATWERFERAYKTADYSDPYMHRIAWQVSVYMVATGLEAVLACWTEDEGVRTFGIETPPFDMVAIVARAGEIKAAVTDLPATCSQADWPCPYAYLHDQPEVVEDTLLDAFAMEYQRYADAEKEAKFHKDLFRDRLMEHGGGVTEGWKVTVSDATTSRYDYAQMEADGIDLSRYRTESVSKRVRVTKRGVDSDPT
jgi:hypothetical protein